MPVHTERKRTRKRKKIKEQEKEIKEKIRFRVRFRSVWIDSLLIFYCAMIKRIDLAVRLIYISVMVHLDVFVINRNSIDIDQKCKLYS